MSEMNNNNTSDINANENAPSNPFVDSYKEMNENKSNDIVDILNMLGNADQKSKENLGNINQICDILGSLSDQNPKNANLSPEETAKQAQNVFGNLLDVLIKSNMLSEPLLQLKSTISQHLTKPTLNENEKTKYESALLNIDTILTELNKPNQDRNLILDTFNKLQDISELDNFFSQCSPGLKEFGDLLK
jgi:hypothetical protein